MKWKNEQEVHMHITIQVFAVNSKYFHTQIIPINKQKVHMNGGQKKNQFKKRRRENGNYRRPYILLDILDLIDRNCIAGWDADVRSDKT